MAAHGTKSGQHAGNRSGHDLRRGEALHVPFAAPEAAVLTATISTLYDSARCGSKRTSPRRALKASSPELGGWERGAGVEYSCQSTANCLPASHNNSGHCEGVRSSTLLRLEYGPENIRLSHQVTVMMVNK